MTKVLSEAEIKAWATRLKEASDKFIAEIDATSVKRPMPITSEDEWVNANRGSEGYIVYKDEGVDAILNQRSHTHGDFADNARLAAIGRAQLRKAPNWNNLSWPQQLALDEIVLKMARILSAGADPNCKEHWDDIVGYATLGGKACLGEEQKPNQDYCIACDRILKVEDCDLHDCPRKNQKPVVACEMTVPSCSYCGSSIFARELTEDRRVVCPIQQCPCRGFRITPGTYGKAQHDV